MICKNCDENKDVYPLFLRIEYVDGKILEGTVEDWPKWRGEGIAYIDVGNRQHGGASIYWLYPENISEEEIAWISGSVSIFNKDAKELIHRRNGEVLMRRRRDLPDLEHQQVKLGWWFQVEN